MEIGAALLCDAATVREGLINVLGGGIARINRVEYPAQLQASLALVVLLHRLEQAKPHELQIVVQDADGKELAEAIGGFEGTAGPDADSTERAYVSLALPIAQVQLAGPSMYSVEISIDGHHQRSISFRAVRVTTPRVTPGAPSP